MMSDIGGPEPRRLRDESDSQLERALLHAGVSYRSTAGARGRAMTALGVATAAATTAAAASAATSVSAASVSASATGTTMAGTGSMAGALAPAANTVIAKLGATFASAKLIAVLSVASAGIAVPVTYQLLRHRTGIEAGRTSAPPRGAATIARPDPARDLPVLPEESERPPVTASAETPPVVRASARRSGGRTAAGVTLTQELVALDAARAKLSGGDATGALSLLTTYQRAYPHGNLRVESEVLRIDALAALGRRGEARRRADAFLGRHANSPLAARVRATVGD